MVIVGMVGDTWICRLSDAFEPGSIQFGRSDPFSPAGGHQHLAPDDDGADSSPGECGGLKHWGGVRGSGGASGTHELKVWRGFRPARLASSEGHGKAFTYFSGSRSRSGAASEDQGQRDFWLYLTTACLGVMTAEFRHLGQCAASGVIQVRATQI